MTEHTLGGETLFYLGNFPITNTLTSTLIADIIIIVLALLIYKNRKLVPGTLQNLMEILFEFVEGLMNNVLSQKKYIKIFFPWIMTMFIYILISNWSGLLPGMESITIAPNGHEVAIAKGANSDLNSTVALSIVSLFLVQGAALYFKGLQGWFGHFFKFKPLNLAVLFLLVGMIELVLEPIKFIALALRLFGNVFAGEILVNMMTNFNGTILYGAAVPFLALEVMVGLIQPLIFCGLTITFISLFLQENEGH